MTNPHGQLDSPVNRPRTVTVALWIIVATFVIGAVIAAVREFVGPSSQVSSGQVPLAAALAVTLVGFGLMGGLIAALAFRRRWAWWIWLVLFVVGLPGVWSGLRRSFEHGWFNGAENALFAALDVAAMILLLLRPSREWYHIPRKFREPNPPVTSDEYDYPNWP